MIGRRYSLACFIKIINVFLHNSINECVRILYYENRVPLIENLKALYIGRAFLYFIWTQFLWVRIYSNYFRTKLSFFILAKKIKCYSSCSQYANFRGIIKGGCNLRLRRQEIAFAPSFFFSLISLRWMCLHTDRFTCRDVLYTEWEEE